MGTKLVTGLSKGKDAREAATKAVEIAKGKLGDEKVALAVVYSSTQYNYQEVVDTVRQLTGGASLIGCSTGGEFTEEKVENQSVAVGLISSDKMKFFPALIEGVKEDEVGAMKTLMDKLPLEEIEEYPYKAAVMFVDGLAGKGEEISIAATNALGVEVKLAGGAAADDLKFEKTFVFCEDKVASNAATICLITSKSPLFTGVKHGHIPLSKLLKATKAKGGVLYEVNNRPAWEVWKEETKEAAKEIGIDVEELKNSTEIGSLLIRYEMGIPLGDGLKIRVPLSKNDDGSINFACTIPQGITFYIAKSEKQKQIESAYQAIMSAKAEAKGVKLAGALIFDCVCRGIILGEDFSKAVEQFKQALGDIPLLGLETYGEICYAPGQFSGFHNTTSVALLFPAE
ncbi:MAG: FIST C-terminal domain-containing protein [Candidatus Omnitrophica bacterium]|nr:FIST C-terminal domain-containing protein [Candidatus Omnitrophota bacterium]MBU4478083.1 FIST C-terminal domain-containing protein [Candidatus Omnitrophota bacterium]